MKSEEEDTIYTVKTYIGEAIIRELIEWSGKTPTLHENSVPTKDWKSSRKKGNISELR